MPRHPYDTRHAVGVCANAARSPFALLADTHARAQQHAAAAAERTTSAPRAEPRTPRAATSVARVLRGASAALNLRRAASLYWHAPHVALSASVVALVIVHWFQQAAEHLGAAPYQR
jgi:hypothetical protein